MKNLNKLMLLAIMSFVAGWLIGSYVVGFAGIATLSLLVAPLDGVMYNSVIPIQDAQSLFTKKLIAVYKEKVSVMSFLRSFFEPVESMTKEISIAVKRGTEKVAVDVDRYTDGNRNSYARSSEKVIVPPFYDEYLTANEHRLYDMAITAISNNDTTYFNQLTQELAEEVMEIQMKIERAIELQCSQVLHTGIIELKGVNIDFKRKAGSLVDKGSGNYWTTGTVDPYKDMENAGIFLRTVGKSQGSVINAIMGSDALTAFLNNPIVKERADIRNFGMDMVKEAQRNSVGAAYHGQVSAGSYTVRLWTYPEYYDINGVSTPYIESDKVIFLPESPMFKLAFAAVPQLIKNGSIPQKGAYLVQEFFDEKATAHEIHVKSCPVAVPVSVDQIYTLKTVA